MQRRGFIKVMAAGGAMAVFPAVLSSCSGSQVEPLKHMAESGDFRLTLISYAMLAPNSHNIQPWKIRLLGEDRFELYVDQERLLPRTDPPARQIHISQGTFLETLRIAASNAGYGVDITYFPKGEYDNLTVTNQPVASVRLYRDSSIRPDPMFRHLSVRQSNKRTYSSKQIAERDLSVLRSNHPEAGIAVFADASKRLRSELTALMGKSMDIEVADRERNIETANIFRFSEKEAIRKGDGFTVANNGITGLMRLMVETFFLGTREEAYEVGSSFAEESVKMAYKQAESAAAFGWIVSDANTRMDQIMAGHIYARINLRTAGMGIAQHPMSQILQEYEDMRELQQEFLGLMKVPQGSTVQMLYRLGYAEDTPSTRRRSSRDILIT